MVRKQYIIIQLYIILIAMITIAMSANGYGQACLRPTIISVQADLNTAEINWIPSYPVGTTYEVELTRLSPDIVNLPVISTGSKPVLIEDLSHSTQYSVRVKAICPEGPTMWSSPFMFNTHLTNEGTCPLGFEVINNNCNSSNYQDLIIQVNDIDGTLGETAELSGVELIMSHTDPSDMDIQLISPSGKSVQLIKNYGLGQNDFGAVDVDDCGGALVFDPRACVDLTSAPDLPLRGRVQPLENFSNLHDNTPANGAWTFRMCDRHIEDVGQLEYVRLIFNEEGCAPPANVDISEIRGQQVKAHWTPSATCDSLIFELVTEGRQPGSGIDPEHPDHVIHVVPCQSGEFDLTGLMPDTEYTLYVRSRCTDDEISLNTCGLVFTTLCDEPSLVSNFDALSFCEETCDTICGLDTIWSNSASGQLQWIINRGSTPTNNTGPSGDLYNRGNYIYVASSNPECVAAGPAVLESTCIQVPDDQQSCFFQFSYHLWGNDIVSFTIDVTADNGQNWDTLMVKDDQDLINAWQTAQLDLSAYTGATIALRFIAMVNGPRGNIALDELLFFGNISLQDESFVFYADADGDGYGDSMDSITSCFAIPPQGFVNDNTDCDDTNPDINPGMDEIPCNLIDDNCSGIIDDAESDLEIVNIDIVSPSCVGRADGQLSLSIAGGQPPYEINWSDDLPGQTQLQDIGTGWYSVTISDDDGCLITEDSVEIQAEQRLSLVVEEELAASCEGIPDGVLAISVLGGQAPYYADWSDGGSGLMRNDLTYGDYSITISDEDGCQSVMDDIYLDADVLLEVDVLELSPPSCPLGSDGTIRLRGKTDPLLYQYVWGDGQEGPVIRNLSSGSYEVTVTRTDNACATIRQFELTDPDSVFVNLLALDPVSCPDRQDGRIEIAVSGGTAPYSYRWTAGNQLFFTRNLSAVGAGDYDLLITDANNCQYQFGVYTINQPAPFELSTLDITPNKCLLSNNGAIHTAVSGGTPDYQYLWSNGTQDSHIDGLFNGNYFLTVTDQFDCKHVFGGFNITSNNDPLETEITDIVPNSCFGDRDGKIIVDVLDGLPPIEYHWSNGNIRSKDQSQDTLNQLSSRTYALTVTDQQGCMAVIESIVVPGPDQALGYNVIDLQMIRCYGEANGAINILPKGGTAPYTTLWNDGGEGQSYEGLSVGDYQFTLTDDNDCELTSPIIRLTQPQPLTFSSHIDEDGCTEGEGSISISPSGGVAPYDVNWLLNGDTVNHVAIQQLDCGIYPMQLMDNNGCEVDTTFYLGVVSAQDPQLTSQPVVYPNPFDRQLTVSFDKPIPFSLRLLTLDGLTINSNHGYSSMATITLNTDWPPGIYILQISTADGHYTYRLLKQ